jgi:hypothetical protein
METVGLLIFFAVVGAFICAKARVAGGAIVFALVALVLFIGTPAGAGLPGMVADFLSAISAASEPLTQGGSEAAG